MGKYELESPRVFMRPRPLREWSYEQDEQVFLGSPGTYGTAGNAATQS